MFEIQKKKFKVEKIVFYNKDSMWGVLGTAPLDDLGDDEFELANAYGNISISGNFQGVYEGCEIEVTGDIISNAKFGKQIQIRTLTILENTKDKEGIINFLARSMIRGISTQNAKKIYEKYKDDAITTVLENPESLLSISGIGRKTVDKIKKSVDLYKAIKPLIEFCTELGLSYGLTMKLHEALGADAITIIKEDPFKILDLSDSISFKQIDEIYIKNGGNPTGRRRLECALLYLLKDLATLEGSTGCLGSNLRSRFYKLLELSDASNSYEKILNKLKDEGKVETEDKGNLGTLVYYKEFLDIEKNISEKITYLNEYGVLSNELKDDIIEEEINNFPFTLNEQQVNAVKRCLNKPISVLTGPAGCISGDTPVTLFINGKSHTMTLKQAYLAFQEYKKAGTEVFIESFVKDKGRIELNEIEDIIYSGPKPVYSADFGEGMIVESTLDHEFCTYQGKYVPLKDLQFEYPVMTVRDSNSCRHHKKLKFFNLIGMRHTFDICCYKHHNFAANRVIVHNCGKSSITKALYRIYQRCGFNTILIAPTAKAALRLSECTGGKAQTIHRFLGLSYDNSGATSISLVPTLDNTVIIIDEASMVDIMLFNKVLERVTLTTKVLLVGDNSQLPSVQAGNVLGDLISSFKVPTAILTDVMRQGAESHIIKYCNMINSGEIFEPCEEPDFHYEEFGTGEELREVLIKNYLRDVKEYGLQEVQVITPYKKGELGMNMINAFLQNKYNPIFEETEDKFRVGDRVRHTVNDYEKNVFNGETGIVKAYDDGDLIVDYGDREVLYEGLEQDVLTLSYCSTVHASQGSEYKVCYVILDDTAVNDFLLIRRLLYTAVSRGKEKVYILSKPYLLDKCIMNTSYRPRITKLADFLKSLNFVVFA